MTPKIETIEAKNLVGKLMRMSLADNNTSQLWQSFIPKRKGIENNLDTLLYSIQIFDDTTYFTNFIPDKEFAKWACVQVEEFDVIPANMETLILPSGLYAVFMHKGMASEWPKIISVHF